MTPKEKTAYDKLVNRMFDGLKESGQIGQDCSIELFGDDISDEDRDDCRKVVFKMGVAYGTLCLWTETTYFRINCTHDRFLTAEYQTFRGFVEKMKADGLFGGAKLKLV
jgi:hypothetical protein